MKIVKLFTMVVTLRTFLVLNGYAEDKVQDMIDDGYNAVGGCGNPADDVFIKLTHCIGSDEDGEDIFAEVALNETEAVQAMEDWLTWSEENNYYSE